MKGICFLPLFSVAVLASPRVVPTPQFLERTAEAVVVKPREAAEIVTSGESDSKVRLAAEMLRRSLADLGPAVKVLQQAVPKDRTVTIHLWNAGGKKLPPIPLSAADKEVLDPARHFGQSYIVRTRGNRDIWIVGSTGQGVLYGATTLLQVLEPNSGGIRVEGIHIRDFPDFRYRAASDWLLRAELNRWAYDWGDGSRAYVARIKRKLEFCTRFKINMVLFDGFGWTVEKVPGYAAMMRELNAYARARGIKLMFSGFGASFDPRKVEPEFNIGKIHYNRWSYPDGEPYRCFGESRTPKHPLLGTCRSNEELLARIAQDFEAFVRAVEPGALYIHHEDTGHYETTQLRWSDRCERCRKRWPNPDFAALDGGAGAMAHGYKNILRAVQGVKNADTGYDASRDCTVVFISPLYGVDSQRSGMGNAPADPDLGWNKTLEFWTNVLEQMPKTPNLEVGFREIFAGRSGKQWVETYRERMTARGLNPNTFIFYLGGADQYSNGAFNNTVTGSPVMNGIFDGAETIYNFNGGLHQEAQQVINAEYSWNSHAPGRMTPNTYEEGLRHWRALMKNEELPEAVFGREGLFARACRLVYGARAGAAISKYFRYYEESSAGALPEFYPRQLYPLIVLWRFLEGDRPYWDAQPSGVERRSLESLKVPRQELQRRLAALWRQTAKVNEQAEKLLAAAASAGDLREDAREDFERLRLCNRVGQRMAEMLAAYHDLLAGRNSRQKVMEINAAFLGWLRSQTRLDFTDPKGGDAASWTESSEILRSRLLALAPE
jgi:hypothetical protein